MVDQIVQIILAFIRDFLRTLRLQKLADALEAQKKKTNEAVNAAKGDYESFKEAYNKWVEEDTAKKLAEQATNNKFRDVVTDVLTEHESVLRRLGDADVRAAVENVQSGSRKATDSNNGTRAGNRSTRRNDRKSRRRNKRTKSGK